MKVKHMVFWLVMIVLLGSSICFGASKVDYSKQGVCVVAETAIRAQPNKNGKWLSSLSVGETVIITSNPMKDPKDPKIEYIKVKLSDGTEGFANTWCVVRGAYVAVIQKQARIYKRPDLLADSNTNFEMMNIVAVDNEKDDWIHATGEERARGGWIDKSAIRKAKEDIVTAVILRKALRGKENTITKEEVEKIVAGLPNPNNYFAVKILQKYQTVNTTSTSNPVSPSPETSPETAQQ